ncbi:MAG: hypothetical protein ACTHMC_03740 [Pseudobacter sp.]|uniref:hypothetical protein n=1 Tax=Pseudobacter sp. TaxID=2045420 RepID=UPI003F7FBA80
MCRFNPRLRITKPVTIDGKKRITQNSNGVNMVAGPFDKNLNLHWFPAFQRFAGD